MESNVINQEVLTGCIHSYENFNPQITQTEDRLDYAGAMWSPVHMHKQTRVTLLR